MDDVRVMAAHLAERVTPDEAEIAPDLLDGLLAGEAVQPAADEEPVLGGFGGPELVSEFVTLVQAMQPCVQVLASLFLMGSASVTMIVQRLALRDRKKAPQEAETVKLPDGETLGRLLTSIESNLLRSGVEPERAAEMSRQAVIALLERPGEGARFVDALAGAKR